MHKRATLVTGRYHEVHDGGGCNVAGVVGDAAGDASVADPL
jgi:hypothetical protein